MSSLAESERTRQIDAAAFSLAAGGALAVATFAAGAATNASDLGLNGAELALVGAGASWWMRRWPPARSLLFGALLGLLAGTYWYVRLEQNLGVTNDEPGLILALRMTLPLVAASFLLTRVEIAAFALVPGVTVLGLAAGQGNEAAAQLGFTIFLPLALLTVGYAMMSTGADSDGAPRLPDHATRLRGPLSWRGRHWTTLGGSILLIMILAQVINIPVASWAAAHRWQIIMGIAAPGTQHAATTDLPTHAANYAIGRGPIKLRDTPLLAYTGDYAPYWRGQVYDRYLGTAWGRSEAGNPQAELEAFPANGTLELAVRGTPVPENPTAQYVTTQADLPFVFYAPGQAVQISARGALSVPASSHVVVNGYGLAEVPGGTMLQGTSYAVTTVSLEPSRTRPAAPQDQVSDKYLKVPFEANRVAELAKKIAGDGKSPERKLAALTGYLQQNCLYDTTAPAIPPGNDAVDYFVFHQKVGYCDLFASSLAVMGRAVGVPTRLVTGYAFPTATSIRSAGRQAFVLRESDGHAWVEAYLPASGGWVTLDATPAGKESAPSPGWVKASLLRLGVVWRNRPLAAVGGILVAVLLLVAAALLAAKVIARRRAGGQVVEQDWRAVVTAIYVTLGRTLRHRGYPRHATETPFEYLAALERRWRAADRDCTAALPPLRTLTDTFVLARYSPAPVTEAAARSAETCLVEVRKALPKRRI